MRALTPEALAGIAGDGYHDSVVVDEAHWRYLLAKSIVATPRGRDGRPDYAAVPVGSSVWIAIDDRASDHHGRVVLATRGERGFSLDGLGFPGADEARGDEATVARRAARLAALDEDDALADREALAGQPLGEFGPFGVLLSDDDEIDIMTEREGFEKSDDDLGPWGVLLKGDHWREQPRAPQGGPGGGRWIDGRWHQEVPGWRMSRREYNEGTHLHGTSADFDRFRVGGHGLIYFSEHDEHGKTQAEHIAEGPFGGRLIRVRIAPGVPLDPHNDPRAAAIVRRHVEGWGEGHEVGKRVAPYYMHAPEIAEEGAAAGYNRFRFWETSVRGTSDAVSDPDLIQIVPDHEEVVREALDAGEPVPAWVLTPYPALHRRRRRLAKSGEVQRPGSRGGKGYWERGKWHYGERPADRPTADSMLDHQIGPDASEFARTLAERPAVGMGLLLAPDPEGGRVRFHNKFQEKVPYEILAVPDERGDTFVLKELRRRDPRTVEFTQSGWAFLFHAYGHRIHPSGGPEPTTTDPIAPPPAVTPPPPWPEGTPQGWRDLAAAALDRERTLAEAPIATPRKKWKKIGGTGKSKPYRVELGEGEGAMPALVKPQKNLRKTHLYDGIPAGEELGRERAAYIVNLALGWFVETPEVVIRQTEEGLSGVQRLIDDTDGPVGFLSSGAIGRRNVTEGERRIALFDAIVANRDRHWNNVLYRNGGGWDDEVPTDRVAIDHGLAFPAPPTKRRDYGPARDESRRPLWGGAAPLRFNGVLQELAHKTHTYHLDYGDEQRLKTMIAMRPWVDAQLHPLIGQEAADEMWRRVHHIVDNGVLPSPEEMFSRPWAKRDPLTGEEAA